MEPCCLASAGLAGGLIAGTGTVGEAEMAAFGLLLSERTTPVSDCLDVGDETKCNVAHAARPSAIPPATWKGTFVDSRRGETVSTAASWRRPRPAVAVRKGSGNARAGLGAESSGDVGAASRCGSSTLAVELTGEVTAFGRLGGGGVW